MNAIDLYSDKTVNPDNPEKHPLQISVLHTSLVVTLTVAITWPDQLIAVSTGPGSNNNSHLLGIYDMFTESPLISRFVLVW